MDVSHLDLDIWPAELLIVAQVKVIAAYKNKLTYIPSLSSFKFLQELDISRNMITSLDEIDFSKLIKLKHLDVSRNYLEQLPQEITQLPLLEELILHRNKLSSLPLDMKNLRALRKLDVSYNDITTVGAILELNDNLEDLNISNNDNLSRQNIGIKAGMTIVIMFICIIVNGNFIHHFLLQLLLSLLVL